MALFGKEGSDSSSMMTEVSEDGENLVYSKQLSSSSCHVDDIEAFIVGGQSSRFWMLRKQIN